MSDYFGKETPKLGFGLMRLPQKGAGTDIKQVKKMVDLFMEAGFTYFDTAFVYGTSETDIKRRWLTVIRGNPTRWQRS